MPGGALHFGKINNGGQRFGRLTRSLLGGGEGPIIAPVARFVLRIRDHSAAR